ncbi:MAG: hypothetical protein IKN73_04405 [Alphaproteobacteria bacterium]|nr:hypothetical protein [Alphaproteobacteria bacterium]
MWKILFEFLDRIFAIVPVKKWREYLRIQLLFDYRRKLNALKSGCPELNFTNFKLAKGGGSIVFILKDKITFKVRKHNYEAGTFSRFDREKRITDALRPFCTIKIPNVEFIKLGEYTFYKSDFIPGKLLINIPFKKIKRYQQQISQQLAEFIYKKSFANPPEIADLRNSDIHEGFAWNHGDMCSNILINPKTMVITGIIDWEWASYSDQEREFRGLVRVRKKMQKIGLDKTTYQCYLEILKKNS